MKTIKFIKDHTSCWYAELPDYPGSLADLEMVCGADTMLDIYAQGDHEVILKMETVEPEYRTDVLEFNSLSMGDMDGGAYYDIKKIGNHVFDLQIWLCSVTVFVFGEYPKKIYVTKVN